MCGIFGLYSKKANQSQIKNLDNYIKIFFKLSKKRGQDTIGLSISSLNNEKIFKLGINPNKIFNRLDYQKYLNEAKNNIAINNPYSFIGQTRLVTTGTKFLHQNNQPIITKNIIGVHNGIYLDKIENFKLNNQESYNVKSDSLLLFNKIDENFEKDKFNFLTKIENFLKNVHGNYSIAFRIPIHKLNFLTSNCGSLYYLKTNDIILFASEKNIIIEFIKKSKIKFIWSDKNIIKILNKLVIFDDNLDFVDDKLINNKYFISNNSVKLFDNITEQEERKNNLKRCSKCILPSTYPFITFDKDCVSNYFKNYKKQEYIGEEKLEEILSKYRSKNGNPDCVVGLSGGRDSSYGLHLIKTKFKMNPIAFTYDWGLTSDISRINQSKICGKLGIEHIIRSANISKKRNYVRNNIMAWLKRPHLGMLPVVQAGDKHFMDLGDIIAKDNNIKLIIQFTGHQLEQREFFLGFAGINQPLKNNQRMSSYSFFNKLKMFYFYSTQSLINPAYLNTSLIDNFKGFVSSFIRKESSLHFYNYIKWDEEKIIETLEKEYDWKSDLLYGKNQWRMGDGQTTFNNFIYYTIAGFSEYDNFRANQICEGLIDKQTALKLLIDDNKFKYDVLKNFSETIGFNLDDVLSKILTIPKLY